MPSEDLNLLLGQLQAIHRVVTIQKMCLIGNVTIN